MDNELIEGFRKKEPGFQRENFIKEYNINKNQLFDILTNIIQSEEKIEKLKELYENNVDAINNMDFRILDDKYINTLGWEKINSIFCYLNFQEDILSLNSKQYEVFVASIDNYIYQNKTSNWLLIADILLPNILSPDYEELIETIELEKIDIDKLTKVLQIPNYFEIKNTTDLQNYEEIKIKKCEEIICNSNDISEIKEAVLQKLFGQDFEYSKRVVEKYGEDIANINDSDEKDYVICLSEIIKLEDIQVLKKIYTECNEIGLVDRVFMEESIKQKYFELYNQILYTPYGKERIENNQIDSNNVLENEFKDLEVYYAGTDFSMIISVIGAVSSFRKKDKENFRENWNRPSLKSLHFCASYIRNDMLGVISGGNDNVIYGFFNMADNSLMASGYRDLISKMNYRSPNLEVDEEIEKYYSPNEQINKTEFYNEMDIARWQNDERKQPDYIVVFRKNGRIENCEATIRAYYDWNKTIPIVVVDVDKCLESELTKVECMLDEYNETSQVELAKNILQKVKNNEITTGRFGGKFPFSQEVKDLLKEDIWINERYGMPRREIERILKIKFKEIERKRFYSETSEIIVDRIKNMLSSGEELNYEMYSLYQDALIDKTKNLSTRFYLAYKDKDKEFHFDDKDFNKKRYEERVQELESIGINVEELISFSKKEDGNLSGLKLKEYIYKSQSLTFEKTEKQVSKEDLAENFEQVSPQERIQYMRKIRNLRNQIEIITSKEEGERSE